MSGWFAFDSDRWPVVVGQLQRLAELTGEAWEWDDIMMDLRWWQDQARFDVARPGRPALRRRWNCTDWTSKKALKAEAEWGTPLQNRQLNASPPPVHRQPTASPPPAAASANVNNDDDSASVPPADRQSTASVPPADRPTRVGDREQRTETENTSVADAKDDEPPKKSADRLAAERVYEAHRLRILQHVPQASPRKALPDSWHLTARVSDHGEQGCLVYSRWLLEAPGALWWREKGIHTSSKPWRPKHMADNIDAARIWASASSAESPLAAISAKLQQNPHYTKPNQDVRPALNAAHLGQPRRFLLIPDDPEMSYRVAAAIRAAGGWSRKCRIANDFDRRDWSKSLAHALKAQLDTP